MFGSIGFMEVSIIVGIAVLLFGPRQLPKVGRALGESIREFRNVGKAITDSAEEIEDDLVEAGVAKRKRRWQ